MPLVGVEPTCLSAHDFESCVSANSTTAANSHFLNLLNIITFVRINLMEKQRDNNNTIFWIEISSIKPNPNQPRKDFDEEQLKYLADSIKQYGILQPLLVVRLEKEVPTGTIVEYELISGERRWRASRIAGLTQVPVIIRKEPVEKVKLELALIENIQREDLNPIEKAKAFKQLAEMFDMRHHEIAQKVGKSRVYVTNTIRLLNLPEEMMNALAEGKMAEGQARALLMVGEKPEAQKMLFEDIIYRGVGIREAEKISRRIAFEKARKQEGLHFNEETRELENRMTNVLGTRVLIDRKGNSGKISISFSSEKELGEIFKLISQAKEKNIFQNENLQLLKEKIRQAPYENKNPVLESPFGENNDLIIKEVSSPAYNRSPESEQTPERDDSLIPDDMAISEGAPKINEKQNIIENAEEKTEPELQKQGSELKKALEEELNINSDDEPESIPDLKEQNPDFKIEPADSKLDNEDLKTFTV
jgi:ParB family transcriptional regulator, chromosome partitioning protein